jgi:predicted transcriptional regulator
MATTSIKIPNDLKQRAINVVQQQNMSLQVFMLGAIKQTVLAVEQRTSFVGEALAAAQEVHEVGVGYAADDVHAYIDARLAGKNPDRPALKPWRGLATPVGKSMGSLFAVAFD